MSGTQLYSEADRHRWVPEDEEPLRTPFRRDYARLLHSPVFRRLQGKTQLFPGSESDFFRNRLTHSLEVAQVAKSITRRLNLTVPEFKDTPIDEDIVEFAGLAHDLGHPPFGHNGERALDECMRRYGGFEGNAQTLRNLRLEKKRIRDEASDDAKGCGVSRDGHDFRAGLNLTARTLAAVLKYDKLIPFERDPKDKLAKGYYTCEQELVAWIKAKVLPVEYRGTALKTIECQIMDLADDIAYSTYDLEDAFKAGFLSPLDLLALDETTRAQIAEEVRPQVGDDFDAAEVLTILTTCFEGILSPTPEVPDDDERTRRLKTAVVAHGQSLDIATNGYARNKFTSDLVATAVEGVEVIFNQNCPLLSRVQLRQDVFQRVETLKRVAYLAIIQSPRLKVAEYRGFQIIKDIFYALSEDKGHQLLPGDYKELYHRFKNEPGAKHRLICDFIAGMTDAYAIEFYSRLKSANANLLFKPF